MGDMAFLSLRGGDASLIMRAKKEWEGQRWSLLSFDLLI